MVQALFMGLVILPEHIGGNFTPEEKEFMIETSNLEFKWRLGKKGKDGSITNLMDPGSKSIAKANPSMLSFGAEKVNEPYSAFCSY